MFAFAGAFARDLAQYNKNINLEFSDSTIIIVTEKNTFVIKNNQKLPTDDLISNPLTYLNGNIFTPAQVGIRQSIKSNTRPSVDYAVIEAIDLLTKRIISQSNKYNVQPSEEYNIIDYLTNKNSDQRNRSNNPLFYSHNYNAVKSEVCNNQRTFLHNNLFNVEPKHHQRVTTPKISVMPQSCSHSYIPQAQPRNNTSTFAVPQFDYAYFEPNREKERVSSRNNMNHPKSTGRASHAHDINQFEVDKSKLLELLIGAHNTEQTSPTEESNEPGSNLLELLIGAHNTEQTSPTEDSNESGLNLLKLLHDLYDTDCENFEDNNPETPVEDSKLAPNSTDQSVTNNENTPSTSASDDDFTIVDVEV